MKKHTLKKCAIFEAGKREAFFCFVFFGKDPDFLGIKEVFVYIDPFFLGIRGRNFEGGRCGKQFVKRVVHSGKTNIAMENGPFEDVSPIKDGDFPPGHVSLLEG